jgi:hypothetical protein
LLLVHPQNGVITVAVNGFVVDAHLVHQRQSMDDGKKFTDVIGATYRPVMKYLRASLQIDAAIFHRSGVATASRIDSPRIGPYFHRKRKHSVISV